MAVRPDHIDAVKRLCREYGATRLVLFGSAVDDPEHAEDLDLAIDGVPGWTIWELAGRIERAVDVPVDVVPLDPSPFTDHILQYGREISLDERPEHA